MQTRSPPIREDKLNSTQSIKRHAFSSVGPQCLIYTGSPCNTIMKLKFATTQKTKPICTIHVSDIRKTRAPVPDICCCMHNVCDASSHMCNALCLNGDGEMRALQCESKFLLGEGQMVVRLDRVVGSAQMLVGRLAEIASVGVLCH
jgi:hypothetical protein